MKINSRPINFLACLLVFASAVASASARDKILLLGGNWHFLGAAENERLPEIGSPAFHEARWEQVAVPHNFQTRAAYNSLSQGWYRRQITIDPALAGKQLYLYCEGAAAIADVYLNERHLGQHRGAYTAAIFDATAAAHPGENELAIRVDNSAASTADCLPNGTGLYKVWGGLHRNIWLLATGKIHIDPTDDATSGVYLTPKNVSEKSAALAARVLLRNTTAARAKVEVRVKIWNPQGAELPTLSVPVELEANSQAAADLSTTIQLPELWEPKRARLYRVQASLHAGGKLLDEVTERTGFRWLQWDWKENTVRVNGRRTLLAGANLHQETERKGSAVSDQDLIQNFDWMQDLGINFIRLPHYPHARLEYDLCDERGLLCWAENGNSNGRWTRHGDLAGPTAAQITRELVKNYNHPSIVLWSVGNEAAPEPADQCVPIVKALDPSRPVVVANMKQGLADYATANVYPGWYGGSYEKYKAEGFISEIGAGGITTTHCDYRKATWKVNTYEPEEYQQLVAESHFQKSFRGGAESHLAMFAWWALRDFSDVKYKQPVGWNSKGLLTYAGEKKDIYFLYRCFLRPDEPTLHIASQKYFLRADAADNGIKVYSNAAKLTLTLNHQKISTLANGRYTQPNGQRIENVFFWPAPLHRGKNSLVVADGHGREDSAVIYFEGAGGLPENVADSPLIAELRTSNPNNQAYFMDMPVQPQWPIYYDLDANADNSFDTLPAVLEGARWIAMRRQTKAGQASDLSFTLKRPATVFLASTKSGQLPAVVSGGQFHEVALPDFLWRDNDLQLVPAQLFARPAAAGETIHFPTADRDQIVLVKE